MIKIGNILGKIGKQDKFIALFFIKAILLYLLWYLLYDKWLLEDGFVDNLLISHLVSATDFVLDLMGYTTFHYADAIGIDGTHGVLIGAPCNGLSLFMLFAGFIIAFPGRIVNKLIFIPIGILIVHLLNIARLVALTLVVLNDPDSLEFNHKYTFTILVYLCIFLLWMIWVKKFANKKIGKKRP